MSSTVVEDKRNAGVRYAVLVSSLNVLPKGLVVKFSRFMSEGGKVGTCVRKAGGTRTPDSWGGVVAGIMLSTKVRWRTWDTKGQ